MYTQCPECKTAFRLRVEQLKAAHGMVRCSQCHTTFDALDNLFEPGQPARDEHHTAQQHEPPHAPPLADRKSDAGEEIETPAAEALSIPADESTATATSRESLHEGAGAAIEQPVITPTGEPSAETVQEPPLGLIDIGGGDAHSAEEAAEALDALILPLNESETALFPSDLAAGLSDETSDEPLVELELDHDETLLTAEEPTEAPYDLDLLLEEAGNAAEALPLAEEEPGLDALFELGGADEERAVAEEAAVETPFASDLLPEEAGGAAEVAPLPPAEEEPGLGALFELGGADEESTQPDEEARETPFASDILLEETGSAAELLPFAEEETGLDALFDLADVHEGSAQPDEEARETHFDSDILLEETESDAELLPFEEEETGLDAFFDLAETEAPAGETTEVPSTHDLPAADIAAEVFSIDIPPYAEGSPEPSPEDTELDVAPSPDETAESGDIESLIDSLFDLGAPATASDDSATPAPPPAKGRETNFSSEALDLGLESAAPEMEAKSATPETDYLDLFTSEESPPAAEAVTREEALGEEGDNSDPFTDPFATTFDDPFSAENIEALLSPNAAQQEEERARGAIREEALDLDTGSDQEPTAPPTSLAEEDALFREMLPEVEKEDEELVLEEPLGEAVVATPEGEAVSPPPASPTYAMAPELVPQRRGSLGTTLLWGSGSLLMMALLALQYLYYYRLPLAENPKLRPVITTLCALADCELPLQRELPKIRLSDHLVQFHPRYEGALLITATLENHASFLQPYPVVEVVMTDIEQREVARRRFQPQQYLVGERREGGFPPNTEVPLMLEVVDPGKEAVGFEFNFY